MGDTIWEVGSLTGIAAVYHQTAEIDQALKHWERALQLLETAGMKNTLVDALMSVGRTYVAAGDDQKALERFERALTLADELGNPRFQSFALRSIGGIYVRRRQPGPAGSYLERSLLAQIGLGDRRIEAPDPHRHRQCSGNPRRASSCRHVVRRCPRAQPRGDRPRRSSKGALRSRPGLNRAWRSRSRPAIQLANRWLSSSRSGQLLTDPICARRISASVHRHYEQQVEILMRLHEAKPLAGFAADAFEAAELARARSLLDNLTQARIELRADVDPDLLKREEAVNKAIRRVGRASTARRRRSAKPTPTRTAISKIATSRSRRKSAAGALATRR